MESYQGGKKWKEGRGREERGRERKHERERKGTDTKGMRLAHHQHARDVGVKTRVFP